MALPVYLHGYKCQLVWECCLLSIVPVLQDLIGTLLNKKFIDELFRPQHIYSRKALRSVCERLAHSSIMRLNTTSMDKVSGHSTVMSCLSYFVRFLKYCCCGNVNWWFLLLFCIVRTTLVIECYLVCNNMMSSPYSLCTTTMRVKTENNYVETTSFIDTQCLL